VTRPSFRGPSTIAEIEGTLAYETNGDMETANAWYLNALDPGSRTRRVASHGLWRAATPGRPCLGRSPAVCGALSARTRSKRRALRAERRSPPRSDRSHQLLVLALPGDCSENAPTRADFQPPIEAVSTSATFVTSDRLQGRWVSCSNPNMRPPSACSLSSFMSCAAFGSTCQRQGVIATPLKVGIPWRHALHFSGSDDFFTTSPTALSVGPSEEP
jgi:hypothetical protein